MFFTGYSLSSLLLIAALALFVALMLQLADQSLKLLRVIPSPLNAWNLLCERLLHKLNRPERSSDVLRSRGRVLIFMLMVISALLGNFIVLALTEWKNDYAEALLLALIFLQFPPTVEINEKDPTTPLRKQIETGGIRLLQRLFAPLTGWLLLGWPGVMMMLTLAALRMAATTITTAIAQPVRSFCRRVYVLPAALACTTLSLAAAFTSKGHPMPGLRAGMEKILTPHAAVILTLAEALQLSLGGPSSAYLDLLGRDWLGSGIARLQPADIKRWHWLLAISHFMLIGALLLLSLLL